ncbi:hypothetical protein Y1Q_0014479 [Alligator mississippiensis]|uniref:Histone H4 n=1 Tax=Alligator mississippiensis TaxID=8496 RepID=A0A151PD98_ALLMI|nr:hypothetical protein Y1Q_0014479 [Alligator mississippiensis]
MHLTSFCEFYNQQVEQRIGKQVLYSDHFLSLASSVTSGSKGLGIGSTKRHRKVLYNIIRGITKLAIRCLAQYGGMKRISSLIYEETCGALKVLLENVIHDAITYMKHTKQKTITTMDMVYVLED